MITITHNQVNHFTTAEQARAYDTAREVMSAVNGTADIFRRLDNTDSDRNKDVGVVVLAGYKMDVPQPRGCEVRPRPMWAPISLEGEATFDAPTGSLKSLHSEARYGPGWDPDATWLHDKNGDLYPDYNCSFSSDDKDERYNAMGITVRRDKATDTLYVLSPAESADPVTHGVPLTLR